MSVDTRANLLSCQSLWVSCRCLQAIITIRVVATFGADKAASGLEVAVPMPKEVRRLNCNFRGLFKTTPLTLRILQSITMHCKALGRSNLCRPYTCPISSKTLQS